MSVDGHHFVGKNDHANAFGVKKEYGYNKNNIISFLVDVLNLAMRFDNEWRIKGPWTTRRCCT